VTAQATVSYAVDFRRPPRPEAAPERPGRVLRVARLLALAHAIEGRTQAGEYRDFADAARKMGLTRARVTQIVNLTLLAPEIQEAILTWPTIATGGDPITERTLRLIVAEPVWRGQLTLWARHATKPACEINSLNATDAPILARSERRRAARAHPRCR
jgi:hypothetical protein